MNMNNLNTESFEILNYDDQLKQNRLMLAQFCLDTAAKRRAVADSIIAEANRWNALGAEIIDAAERGLRPRIRVNSDGEIVV